jgi:hypothetical protein
MKFFLCAILVAVCSCIILKVSLAAEWQWSLGVKSEKPENDPVWAWLWILPNFDKIRDVFYAVIGSGLNLPRFTDTGLTTGPKYYYIVNSKLFRFQPSRTAFFRPIYHNPKTLKQTFIPLKALNALAFSIAME